MSIAHPIYSGGALRAVALLLSVWLGTAAPAAHAEPPSGTASESLACAPGAVHASGAPDRALFARVASRGVRAEWCERYDAWGSAIRTGPYRERYPNGGVRAEGSYREGRLSGPLVVWLEDGTLFLRGHLEAGEWSGRLTLHRPEGPAWLEASYSAGELVGPVVLRPPDAALAARVPAESPRD